VTISANILVEADYLIGRSEGLSFDAFVADETLRRAFGRSLEMIGEATKKVPGGRRRVVTRRLRAAAQLRPSAC
jgi:uncharacterized protein with HEPN domain